MNFPIQEPGSNTVVTEQDIFQPEPTQRRIGPIKKHSKPATTRRKRDESKDTDFGTYLYEDLKRAKDNRIERTIEVPNTHHLVMVGKVALMFENPKEDPTLWQIAQQFRTKLLSMSKSKVRSVKDYLRGKLDGLSQRLKE